MKNNWNKLDNAAKIFPAADSKSDSQVFRFSCELNQPIQPELLQHALDNTIRVFPAYQCVLKRGLFWYYLESTDMKPVVREEYKPPCSPLYDKNRKSLLFEVTYYRNRIHLEVYHVLSDGTGAMYFLKTLLAKYLAAAKGAKEPSLDYDATAMQMETDSFQKYYNDEKPIRKTKNIAACKLRGQKYNENRLKVITGHCSVKEVLKAAHSYQTTLTAFLCACMMQAISEELSVRAKKKPVILAVPVNLRNFFPSVSARNFFSLIFTDYNFHETMPAFAEIVKKIDTDFKQKLSREYLANSINMYSAVERNIFSRIVPLVLKDFFLGIAYQLSSLQSTATLSNIGIVTFAEEYADSIRSFDVYVSTNKLQACVCSFRDTLSISFTSPFISSDIQRNFFRILTNLGIQIEITTNPIDDWQEV